MGWWFGRIMTFEVIADAAAPGLSAILGDASGQAIESKTTQTVVGYAAYGRSIAAAVQPLVDCFDVPLFDDGEIVRSPVAGSPVLLGGDELGSSADSAHASRIQREQLPLRSVPSALRLTYCDPARDYQTGEARAIAGEQESSEAQQELPAVLSADNAKSLVEQILARQWAARDRLTLRLPPGRMAIEPGTVVQPGLTPESWIVDKATIDGFVTIAEMRPAWQPVPAIAAEAGRIVANADVIEAPTTLALIDAPNVVHTSTSGPAMLIAASSPNSGWTARLISVSSGGQTFGALTAVRKSVLGQALTVLADAEPYLIDQANGVDVELIDKQQWLTSCDDDALAEGVNLAFLGGELVQFAEVTPLGEGRFRLGRLLRGRAGTEWARADHSAGETFCLLSSGSIRPMPMPVWARGAPVTAADRSGSTASLVFGAESIRPLQPDNLTATVDGAGNLTLSWTRRSRAGFAWLDEVDAALGEGREQYRVTVTGATGGVEFTCEEPSIAIAASDLTPLGDGGATIEVRQLGDWAASRPAQISINLN